MKFIVGAEGEQGRRPPYVHIWHIPIVRTFSSSHSIYIDRVVNAAKATTPNFRNKEIYQLIVFLLSDIL